VALAQPKDKGHPRHRAQWVFLPREIRLKKGVPVVLEFVTADGSSWIPTHPTSRRAPESSRARSRGCAWSGQDRHFVFSVAISSAAYGHEGMSADPSLSLTRDIMMLAADSVLLHQLHPYRCTSP